MRKIALVLPTLSPLGGGVSEAARLHVAALAGPGVELSVHTLSPSLEKVDLKQWAGASVHLNRAFGPASYSFAPGMLASLFRARPDIVHVHGVWQFQCAATAAFAAVTGKPYVVTPHGMLERWIRARSPKLKAAVSALYQDRFLRKASGFHLLTEKEREDVAEWRSGQPERIIINYVAPFSDPGGRPGWFRPEHEGRKVYLFLGRIHEKKGIMELCAAWDRLSAADKGFRERSLLVFCGWNDGVDGFEARVADLGKRFGNALFAGPQYGADKARSLAAATFFLLPSKSEGLPMAVLEAWAAGKPAILTPECNLPIGFSEGAAFKTGFTPDAILASLVAADQMGADAVREAGVKAQALAARDFSVTRVRQELLNLYDAAEAWRKGRS